MTSIIAIEDSIESLRKKLLDHNERCLELSKILTQEQESIIQNNAEDLLAVLETKQSLIGKIEEAQLKINKIIEVELKLELSTKSILRFFKQYNEVNEQVSAELQKLWGVFIEQSQVIEQKNLVNGHLLNKQNAKNQLLISLLRGQKPSTSLYGENGKSSRPSYRSGLNS